jgi:hypothetical protein
MSVELDRIDNRLIGTPSSSRVASSAKRRAMRSSSRLDSAAVCGLTSTLGCAHSGESASGSTSKTSIAANETVPSSSAASRAASSMTVPRPRSRG